MIKRAVLKIKHRKILDKMSNLEISYSALNNYKKYVHGNVVEDDDTLRKKLRRNFTLGIDENSFTKKYGNLYIYYQGNLITNIYNQKGKSDGLKIDKKLKEDLDCLLGL